MMSEPFCLTEDILVVYICECIYASKNTRMRVYGVCTFVVYVYFYVSEYLYVDAITGIAGL